MLKGALKLNPARNDLNFKLANLPLKLHLLNEAVASLSLGLAGSDRNADATPSLAVSKKLVEVDPFNPEFRVYFAHVLVWSGRKPEAGAELVEAAKLLREPHPDLAARAEAIELKTGTDSTSSELAAVKALRLQLHGRLNLERNLLLLDFEQPN
jgi:hypothetical protein